MTTQVKVSQKRVIFSAQGIAAAIGNTLLRYRLPDSPEPVKFLSHHAGLTAAEMYVPLILIKTP